MRKIIITIAVVLFMCFIILLTCMSKVPTGHTGVLTTFGKVSNYTLDAGIHFKAPWQHVVKMDNRIQRGTEELSCFSSDLQEVLMKYTLNYQISAKDAMTIYKNIGSEYYNTVMIPTMQEAVKVCVARYTAEQLIAKRTELAAAIEETLADGLGAYNILINSTSIEDIDFADSFTDAVEAKQVAQQNKLKAETEAEQKVIEAEAAANVKKVNADADAYELIKKAEAEAEAYRLVSESLTDKVLSKMYYDIWDGKLPQVITSGEGTLLNIPIE